MSSDALQVLLVDDDAEMLRTLSDILRMRGYTPRIATTGGEGLELIERLEDPVAIALLDLRLPDMDGIDLIRRLHDLSPQTEVVILTGNATLDTAVRALQEHTFDYLTKPVEPSRLLNTLERAGERWRRKLAESALSESEERLRSMFQAIGDSVFITDVSGRIVDANQAAVALTGSDLEALQQHSLAELLQGVESDTIRIVGTADSQLISPGFDEYLLTTREGKSIRVEVITAAFTSDRFVHTARDQTERRRLEEQLRQVQRLEAVGQLAGGLAHDFNNVLTAIKGYAYLIAAEVESTSFPAEGLREIIAAADRAGRLTRELLTFSRRQIYVPKVLDLNAVVLGVEGMLRRLIRENIEFVIEVGGEAAWVKADKGQLEQILLNLAVNAGDAMPEGGRLTIHTAIRKVGAPTDGGVAFHGAMEEVCPGDYVVLTVADSGTGMDGETRARIFEPFFTTKEVGKGTGLGLSTVYGIVIRSEGYIQVESGIGEGTTFTLYFPLHSASTDDAAKTEDAISAAFLTGSETIIVAEDDPSVRTLVQKALEMHGYHVLVAGNPEEVLEVARNYSGPIHLLLSDLVMPGLGGRALAARIAETHPEARAILTSGYARSSADRQALDEFDGFLQKPFTIADLLHEIRRILSKE